MAVHGRQGAKLINETYVSEWIRVAVLTSF